MKNKTLFGPQNIRTIIIRNIIHKLPTLSVCGVITMSYTDRDSPLSQIDGYDVIYVVCGRLRRKKITNDCCFRLWKKCERIGLASAVQYAKTDPLSML